jgi:hypothetical protein
VVFSYLVLFCCVVGKAPIIHGIHLIALRWIWKHNKFLTPHIVYFIDFGSPVSNRFITENAEKIIEVVSYQEGNLEMVLGGFF